MTRTDRRWDGRWLAIAVAVFVGLPGNGLASFLLAGIAVYMFSSTESSMRKAEAEKAKTERQCAAHREVQEREAAPHHEAESQDLDDQFNNLSDGKRLQRAAYRAAWAAWERGEVPHNEADTRAKEAWEAWEREQARAESISDPGATTPTPAPSTPTAVASPEASQPTWIDTPEGQAAMAGVIAQMKEHRSTPPAPAAPTASEVPTDPATPAWYLWKGVYTCAVHGPHCHPEGEHDAFCAEPDAETPGTVPFLVDLPPTGGPAERVEWHYPPDGADWVAHQLDADCLAHLDAAGRGEVPYGGALRHPGEDGRGDR